jgi:hypothetical protein
MQENNKGGQPRKPPAWVRPLSYILIGTGLVLTFFYDRFDLAGTARTIVQFGAIGLLIAGALLFFSVKDRAEVDRGRAYRELFGRDRDDKQP